MQLRSALAVVLLAGCATKYLAPNVPPTVGPPIDLASLPQGQGWSCWRGTANGVFFMGACKRTPEDCAKDRDYAVRERGGQDVTYCAPAASAVCYSYTLLESGAATRAYACFPDHPLCDSMRCSRNFERDCSLCADVP
jgi:hypothetical protein